MAGNASCIQPQCCDYFYASLSLWAWWLIGIQPQCCDYFYASLSLWAWWLIGRVDACRLEGHGFESGSSCHEGTLGKPFTLSCLWYFNVKLRHSIRAVSGAPLSSGG